MSAQRQRRVTASRAPGATAPCRRHTVNTLGAGWNKRWATRVLESRVTRDAISLPPQEGCGRAVGVGDELAASQGPQPEHAIPRPSKRLKGEALHLSRAPSGASLTVSSTLTCGEKGFCESRSEKKVVSSLHEERLWDGLWIVSSGSPNDPGIFPPQDYPGKTREERTSQKARGSLRSLSGCCLLALSFFPRTLAFSLPSLSGRGKEKLQVTEAR